MKKKLLLFVVVLASISSFAQCNYSFLLKDSFGDGWNGARMSVRQNGVTVATLGATFTNGTQVTIQVPLQDNVAFELFWETGGSFPGEVGISVINPFTQTLYTKPSNSGTPNTVLFSAMANCQQPVVICTPPTTLGVNTVGTSTANITWVNPSDATQWEVMVFPAGSPFPTQAGVFTSTNSFAATGLNCSTNYSVFVRAVCQESNPSNWVGPMAFQTLTCIPQAASVCTGANSLCSVIGTIFPNTVGSPTQGAMGCLGTTKNATWFSFSANTTGTVNLQITENSNFDINANPIGMGQDADFILYGPYASPLTSCTTQLTADKIVACSYSAAAVENASFTINQTGGYYYLMVTNFGNAPGFIKISQTGGTALLDCQGFRLNAFLDSNANGINDLGDVAFPHGQFVYEKNNDGTIHNIASSNGYFNIVDANPANTYDFGYQIHSDYSPYFTLAASSFNDVSTTAAGMTNINFPITAPTAYTDVALNVLEMGAPRPGFSYKNKILYTNNGNQVISSGSLLFVKNPLVAITAISQSGTVATPTGFSYAFANLQPFETRAIDVTMTVPTIPTVHLGDILTNSASVSISSTDEMPANNNASITQVIIGSYDPNDIHESHGEEILYSSFTSNDYLYYTIRFENTGSASAINVKVNNILDTKLDENSIKIVGSSANLIMDRVGRNINWDFKNIMLAAGGKGYIVYQIKPKPGYASGDIIPNNASIYFDSNPAITTNTFNTEFVSQLGVEEFENTSFLFYPNPAKDFVTVSLKNGQDSISNITVYDLFGKVVLDKKPSSAMLGTIDLSHVPKGMYLIEVTTQSNLKVIKKLIVE
ncbi:T9SS type A sorting domain-containing protein [Flavobacterium humi]|uniref:T9SS type A sorting domain-containing protein n=1 Tax=Flavobacterium humi TaxID=2562683 RepID=A0A4Z0L8T4_9FLAO|nr:T9SS type A sorting domain-containing protein [Flavobacterium humi]TGD58419.1 T9SS type A sorting domain-containing protein [Flavobacterium humi]